MAGVYIALRWSARYLGCEAINRLLPRSKAVSQVCLYPAKDLKIQALWFGLYFGRMVASFFNDPGAEFRNV